MAIRRNVVANYLGQGWVALMGIAFLPQYIGYLGIEAYGLVGLLAALQAVFILLDFGITPTLVREMARFTARAPGADLIREVLRTLEWISFITATIGMLAVWGSAEWVAGSWLRLERLNLEQAIQAILLLGLVAGLRLIEGLYRGALIGLQKQVWLNSAASALATLRWMGGLGILAWWSPTIVAFFAWQAFISLVTVAILAMRVYQELPTSLDIARFSWPILKGRVHFSSGMMINAALALLLTQTDKILLSRILTLEEFGYYTLTLTIANLIPQFVVPISQAFYPHMTKQATSGDISGLSNSYHLGSQLVGAAIFPAGLMLVIYGENILHLWSGSADLGNQIALILSLLTLGNMLHGATYMPNMLRLAHGLAWFAAKVNAVAVGFFVPALLWAASNYGAVGAAWAWLGLNLGYVALAVPMMHRQVLPREIWKWFREDLAFPLLAVTSALLIAYPLEPTSLGGISMLSFLLTSGAIGVFASVLASPLLRQKAVVLLSRLVSPTNR
jgi:O-antigen/teichoic acid export membrane protein